jgi:hypothetical protein
MKPSIVRHRGRVLASLTATMGLCLAGAAVVSAPAQSAEPAGDCAPSVPVSVTKGDAVTGLTVTGVDSGTVPDGFTGSVLGVVQDGIAPDLDMVMVRLTSPEIDRVGGIWQGMSGSPVYGPDDQLIGAVAYGLAWGPTPVAGVTPFADMDEYLGTPPPAKVAVSSKTAQAIARNTGVTRAQAQEGFAQLRMPTGVSGVSASRLQQAAKQRADHKWLPKSVYRMGAPVAGAAAAGPETIVAGGNLAASLSYGDVTQAGLGTATSVCNGRVVGFGHPMSFLGRTTMTMHPADALYIQEDSLGAPFKMANLGAPAGTITDDHLTGITGSFGALPDTMDVTSSVSYAGRSRDGVSHVSVPEAAASTTFYELLGNHDRVLDAIVTGSELQSWTITGHDEDATPFSLAVTDRYASDYDITFDSSYEVADFVYALSSVPGVTIDGVSLDSDVNDDSSVWRVSKVQQRRAGAWHTLNRQNPAIAQAGRNLSVRAVLTSGSHTRSVPVSVAVPARTAGQRGRLMVTGGSWTYSNDAYPSSLKQAKRYVATYVRNDQVLGAIDLLGPRGEVQQTGRSTALDKVVTGAKRVRVLVR